MKRNNALRFVLAGGILALVAGLPLLPIALGRSREVLSWSLIGWALASGGGLACGVLLNQRHGAEGNAFVATLGICMLARFAAYFVVAIGAAVRGFESLVAYLAGLAVGYVSLQAFEMFWLHRMTRRS